MAARAATMAAGTSFAVSLVIRRGDFTRSTAAFIVVVIYAGIFLVRTAALVTVVVVVVVVIVAFIAPVVLILGCSYVAVTPRSAIAGILTVVVVASVTPLLPACSVVGTIMLLSVGFDLIAVVVPMSINCSVICIKLVSCAANFRSIRLLEFCTAMASTIRPLAATMTTATTTKSAIHRYFILTMPIEERAKLNGLVNDAGARVAHESIRRLNTLSISQFCGQLCSAGHLVSRLVWWHTKSAYRARKM